MSVTLLDLGRWDRPADEQDRSLLDLCHGPTIDIGCGPGRLAAALAERGQVALGIDLLGGAVGAAVRRGASALCRDVFDTLPGEGRWGTVLLADGNVGIGGDPVVLLRRMGELLAPDGRVVAELAAPGTAMRSGWAELHCEGSTSAPVPWCELGVDDVDDVAAAAGLLVGEVVRFGERWCAVMERA